ncbi:quinone oxidoreductase family protein [Cryptosporangium arvum]|uniref:Zn-dependent oxidoreductase, NADPH:quinone reductase n=1 Tax=Cryptosporangium arvum DSM 44712 TaxID=927661 RepID=A0A010ZWH8_9ACTN|nr:zinc-binding dehydrogenase [Cryptosporangium arvum]EXG81577.1 Zn-dependent oxidoreductase, NADPH:quinone reductase [Cryptosporangium arvum DSM 44712]
MRRVRYYEYGGPDVLRVEDAGIPEPGPGQVRLRAEVIGTNFVDTRFRLGPAGGALFARPLPGRPTGDVVGVVDTIGPGVDASLAGRRVGALVAEDAYAEYSLAGADDLVPIPDGVDDGTATTLASTAPVALGVLRLGRLAAGETVLVHAAAGGIGHLIVQLARQRGARVIATASSASKLEFARSFGADAGVDHTAADWPEQVRAAAPGGVDLVVDAIGGDVLRQSVDLLAPFGRAVVYGAAGGELTSVPVTSLFGLRAVLGFSYLAWRAAAPAQARDVIAELTRDARAGRLRAAVHARLPLADAAAAHRILDDRVQHGRVLLVP